MGRGVYECVLRGEVGKGEAVFFFLKGCVSIETSIVCRGLCRSKHQSLPATLPWKPSRQPPKGAHRFHFTSLNHTKVTQQMTVGVVQNLAGNQSPSSIKQVQVQSKQPRKFTQMPHFSKVSSCIIFSSSLVILTDFSAPQFKAYKEAYLGLDPAHLQSCYHEFIHNCSS